MSDVIEIADLLLRTVVGVNPEERTHRQDVVVNLWLTVDARPAAASDDIADAVNYRTITKAIIERVESTSFQLIERLAEEIARLVLRDPGVLSVRVSVQKPGALRFARTVGIVIERDRNDV